MLFIESSGIVKLLEEVNLSIMRRTKIKKYILYSSICLLVIILVTLSLLWNHYLNKSSLLTRFVTEKEQEVYLLGTFHTNHFNKWLNYSMEDVLSVVENVEPDVVFIEAREEYFRQYGVVDGPIDMNIVYSYCLDNDIQVEMIDWWVVDNNYQSDTTSAVRDDNIFSNINSKLQKIENNAKVLVVCGAGHFYEQAKRFENAGFIEKSILQKSSYYTSQNTIFEYPSSSAEIWEKRAYFYAYTYPEIIGKDDELDESIKQQFTGGNHDAFYRNQTEYCNLLENNILFEE